MNHLVVTTQYGLVPDIAFDEMKQIRQPVSIPLPVSLPFAPPTFQSITPPTINFNQPFPEQPSLLSNPARGTIRDTTISGTNVTARSRSLAPNPLLRSTFEPTAINLNNPTSRIPVLPQAKQSHLNPTKFDIRRLNPGITAPLPMPTAPAPPANSSMSYASSRSLPVNSSSQIKPIDDLSPRGQPNLLSPRQSNYPSRQNPQYETTYRASFIKPLVP